ncbi:hypothetical protein Avbf_05357 [Armadillidium vulgare]|nr:hypothetical protein Avbf_05357 [Armadillidium vulgare]
MDVRSESDVLNNLSFSDLCKTDNLKDSILSHFVNFRNNNICNENDLKIFEDAILRIFTKMYGKGHHSKRNREDLLKEKADKVSLSKKPPLIPKIKLFAVESKLEDADNIPSTLQDTKEFQNKENKFLSENAVEKRPTEKHSNVESCKTSEENSDSATHVILRIPLTTPIGINKSIKKATSLEIIPTRNDKLHSKDEIFPRSSSPVRTIIRSRKASSLPKIGHGKLGETDGKFELPITLNELKRQANILSASLGSSSVKLPKTSQSESMTKDKKVITNASNNMIDQPCAKEKQKEKLSKASSNTDSNCVTSDEPKDIIAEKLCAKVNDKMKSSEPICIHPDSNISSCGKQKAFDVEESCHIIKNLQKELSEKEEKYQKQIDELSTQLTKKQEELM